MENNVKKKRFNVLKLIVVILFLYLIISLSLSIIKKPINNIVITGTNRLTDEEIIEIAKLDNYPSFIRTSTKSIQKKIKKLTLVNNVTVKKQWNYKLLINVDESKVLFKKDNKYILSNGQTSDVAYLGVPEIINFVPNEIYNNFVKEYSLLSNDVISRISQIEYSKSDYDDERFILYMIDTNKVIINIDTLYKLKEYVKIVKTLSGAKGTIYLDSGNYFEKR